MSTFNELIDFTRSTTGTYLDSVVYGPELVTNGTFDTNIDGWVVGGAASLSHTSLGIKIQNNGYAYQIVPTVAGKRYVLTGNVTAFNNGNSVADYEFRVGTSVYPPNLYDGPSQTGVRALYATFTATTTTSFIVLKTHGTTGGTQTVTWDNISVKEVIGGQVSGTPLLRTAAINEPRLEYDASGNPLGLLIEEARTNLFINSIPNSSWIISNTTLSFNVAESPDGQATAGLFAETATVGAHMTYQSGGFNFVGGTAYTSSVYVKANTATSCQLTTTSSGFGSTAYANFDLSNGTLGTTGASATSSIQEIGNGWYRISMTATSGTSVSGSGGFIALNNNNPSAPRIPLYAGDTSQSIYVWGNQVETGAFPTSYIPTSGSTVTRTPDVASVPVERFAFNGTKGSVVVSAEMVTSSSSKGIASFKGNASLENIGLYEVASGNIVYEVRSSSTNQASYNVPLAFNNFKVGYVFKNNDFNLAVNGTVYTTDTSGVVPTGLSALLIGSIYDVGTNLMNGHIKQIQYYPKRLSNEELQFLTQPSASPTMNLTFDGQATSTLVEGLHD